MTETLTVADLATSLTEVLERVRGGEHFVIERDGEVIATIVPPLEPPSITWGEFVALLDELPRPDPGFADDIAALRAARRNPEIPEWPD